MKKYESLYHYDTCGLDNIYLKGGVFVTEVNGEKCFSITDVDGLHKAIANNLINKKAPLTNKEFRFLRVELGKTQEELAVLFGCDVQTIANYEKAKTTIPKTTDMLLRIMHLEGQIKLLEDKLNEMEVKKVTSAKPKRNIFELNKDWHPKQRQAA